MLSFLSLFALATYPPSINALPSNVGVPTELSILSSWEFSYDFLDLEGNFNNCMAWWDAIDTETRIEITLGLFDVQFAERMINENDWSKSEESVTTSEDMVKLLERHLELRDGYRFFYIV
jgi:hypothetical protein